MLTIHNQGMYYKNGSFIPARDGAAAGLPAPEQAKQGTMAYAILKAHNTGEDMDNLAIRFDAMASHDITYVGIIQTARASGMTEFPLPYVLTNCHNSLCAVGGTINEDDHVFGLSAAKKYGGEFVPAHQSVIHSYMRERYAAPGKMILGSDSHTRYGAYGTMAIGEGGPELARQLLKKTYNIAYPRVIAIYLTGAPIPGVGPQDVALELIRSTFKDGTVKNAVMEFFGPGVANLSMDYRSGIDVMTTETTCLSSVWPADDTLKDHLAVLGRGEEFKPQAPADGAYYDGVIEVDLSAVRPMIALPFHPSNAYTIKEFKENMDELLHQVDEDTMRQLKLKNQPASLREKIVDGKFMVDQGVIAGCSGGTYQNIVRAAQILDGRPIGSGEFWLSVYPTSQPVNLELTRRGYIASLMAAGASIRSCFCGPCFGAGDVPANGGFSIRHSTRNFPNREGSKPSDGQVSYVALMDARSIAATALNGGVLTAAVGGARRCSVPDAAAHGDAGADHRACAERGAVPDRHGRACRRLPQRAGRVSGENADLHGAGDPLRLPGRGDDQRAAARAVGPAARLRARKRGAVLPVLRAYRVRMLGHRRRPDDRHGYDARRGRNGQVGVRARPRLGRGARHRADSGARGHGVRRFPAGRPAEDGGRFLRDAGRIVRVFGRDARARGDAFGRQPAPLRRVPRPGREPAGHLHDLHGFCGEYDVYRRFSDRPGRGPVRN